MGKRGASRKSGSKSRGKSKGGGKGAKSVKKGKLKADPGGKAGGKGKKAERSQGRGGKGGKGGGKKDPKKGDQEEKGKGKGRGKGAPPGAPKLTRKERKKASIARAKGYVPTKEEAPKPAAPVLGQVKKKGKKRIRPGQSKRQGGGTGGTPVPRPAEEGAKPKKVRVRNRSARTGHGGEEAPSTAPRCKKGHSMGHRSDNPATYKNLACCDVCGKENLPKLCSKGKLSHFFHCSFCRFDMCPVCAVKGPHAARLEEKDKQNEKEQTSKKKVKKVPELDPNFIPRARREMWIPTEAEAVNRAPLQGTVLSAWVEGCPV